MHNHAPSDYICPICLGVQGIENEQTLLRQTDLVYKDRVVSVFVNSFFIGNNPGHIIVVPNKHSENIYDLPDETAHQIITTAKRMAIVLKKAYSCEGITVQQNNEPAGGQHAFHYHLHLFLRYANDNIYQHMTNKRLASPEERKKYADKLKTIIDL